MKIPCLPLPKLSLRLPARLSTRLAVGFGLVLVLLLAITALALERMQSMQSHTREIVEVGQQRLLQTQAMMNASNDAAVALFGFMLTSDEIDVKTQQELYDGAIKRYAEADTTLQALLGSPDAATVEQQKKIADAGSAAQSFARNIARIGASGGDLGAAFRSMDPRQVLGEWRREIEALVALQRSAAEQSYEEAKTSYQRARFVLGLVALLACAAGAVSAWLILRSVTRPLRLAVHHAQRIATGDLSQDIAARGHDEMAELLLALSQMQQRLHAMVSLIRACSAGMGTASSEIAQGNQDLSQRTEQTAGRLEQTASSLQQLTEAVQQTAGSAQTAKQLADSACSTAAQGGQVVGAVVTTMGHINASSKKIGDIIGVIDSIAFQTNVLALNAAVEAARAGEQGRGFAVVATEVRSLAQRSAAAAQEIKALIGSSVGQVEEGARLVQDAGKTMSDIVGSVHRVTDMIGAITAAAGEQSTGLAQVNGAVAELDRMTQQNAALVEQSAAAAESLKQQAHRLAEAIQGFRVERV